MATQQTGEIPVSKPLGAHGWHFQCEIQRLLDEAMQRQAVISRQSFFDNETRARLLDNEIRLLRESLAASP